MLSFQYGIPAVKQASTPSRCSSVDHPHRQVTGNPARAAPLDAAVARSETATLRTPIDFLRLPLIAVACPARHGARDGTPLAARPA